MSFLDQMIDLQNATPGNTAILKLSYNATYDKITFILGGGLTKAMIHSITGKANGVTFFEDDGSLLSLRDTYQGVFVDPNRITLDFTEPNSRGGASAQYLASLPRNLLNSLTFEIVIDATAPAAMTLKAEAIYRDPTQNPFILRRKRFVIPLPVNGDNDYVLPSGQIGGLVKRVYIHHGGQLANIELRTNGTPRKKGPVASYEYEQKRNRLVPQGASNLTIVDFLEDGNLMGMLNTTTVTETLLRLTTSAGGGQATVYMDYVADLRSLS